MTMFLTFQGKSKPVLGLRESGCKTAFFCIDDAFPAGDKPAD
jgi:hypothetical protein